MTTEPGQVTEGDITIDSNHESEEQIAVAFQDDTPPAEDAPAVEASESSEAASESPEVAAAPPKKRTRRNAPPEAVTADVGAVQGDARGTHG